MSGKRIVIAIVFSLIVCCLQGAFWPVQAMERPSAGLLSFGGNAEREYCQLAANKLVSLLAENFSYFALVDPGEVQRLTGEEDFPTTSLSEAEAIALGWSLGIDIVFTGSLDWLSYNYPWAEARVTVKALDVGSGQFLYFIIGYGKAHNTDGQTAMRNAVEDCFSPHFLSELRRKVIPYSTVSAVEGGFLYFHNGREIGIREGMQYRIWREGEAGYRTEIGTAEVTEVSGNISRAKITWAAGEVREGDYLEEIPPAPKERPVVEGEWGRRPAGKKPEREPAPVRTSRKRNVTTFSYTPVLRDENTPFNLVEIRPRQEGKCFFHGSVLGLGYGNKKDLYLKAGCEAGLQLPVASRFFALTFGGTVGYAFLHRGPHEEFFRSQSLSSGFYCSFSAGIRFYLFGHDGLRLEYDSLTHRGPGKFRVKGHRFSIGIPLK